MLEHQIEQLYRLRDLGFRHWLSAPMLATNAPYHATEQSAAPLLTALLDEEFRPRA
jgi:hypothetical protein